MQLAEYQEKIRSDIYRAFVDEEFQWTLLYGEHGCGKSYVLDSLSYILLEDWKVFYVIGAGHASSPYTAWYNGGSFLMRRSPHFSLQNATIGFSGFPILPSFELELSVDKHIMRFNSTEISLIDEIQKYANGNRHLLIVIDDYDSLDSSSISFLEKLLRYRKELFSKITVHCIISSVNNLNLKFKDLSHKTFSISPVDLSDSDIIDILHKNGYHKEYDIEQMRKFAGADLNLIMMIADYYDQTGNYDGNMDIYQKRYSYYISKSNSACEMLKPLSLTELCFSTDEAAFFSSSKRHIDNESILNAEENLSFAKNENIIAGNGEHLYFQNNTVKGVFKSQIRDDEKRYHLQFCDYLRKYHPEDYYNRALHQMMAITLDNTDQIRESWQMMMLYYIRNLVFMDEQEIMQPVLKKIEDLIMRINVSDIQDKQRAVFHGISDAFTEYRHWEYGKAVGFLALIHKDQLSNALLTEYMRIKLICLTQLAKDKQEIQEVADDLLDLVTSENFDEDEVACQALLVLMNIYYDHVAETSKCKIISKKLDYILQKHYRNTTFVYFNMIKNRKAALFFSASVAMGCTKECVIDAERCGNVYERFFAYCNHAGNSIIAGNYNEAGKVIRKADELRDSLNIPFPSIYKIENNRLLLEYLTKECKAENENDFKAISLEMVNKFEDLLSKQGEEISHVVDLNCLSLKYMAGTIDIMSIFDLLDESSEDAYYSYFLHDLLLAHFIISKDQERAKEELRILNHIDVPLLKGERYLLKVRNKIQRSIIEKIETIDLNPYRYHQTIARGCVHVQDPSCYFWGRGFLLSDLQYLSFN